MKKLLLTGASGFLGWNVCSISQNKWEIHGIVNRHEIFIDKGFVYRLNLTDLKSIQYVFQQIEPDAVLHTAAITDANYCQEHPEISYSINVDVSIYLAQLCAEKAIPYVFTSSDLVFNGKKGNYIETDEVNPVSIYGEQKAKAEQGILKNYSKAAICRMPLMLGDAGPVATSYLQHFIKMIKKGSKQNLFVDEFRSPIGGHSAVQGVLLALESFQGIYHLGGPDKLSRYELGSIITEVFNLDRSLVIPGKQADIKMSAPRPRDVSMDSSKAKKSAFKPANLKNELTELMLMPL